MPQQIMSPPQLVWALAMRGGITFFCLSMFPVPSSMTNPSRHSCQLTQTNLAGQMPIGCTSRFWMLPGEGRGAMPGEGRVDIPGAGPGTLEEHPTPEHGTLPEPQPEPLQEWLPDDGCVPGEAKGLSCPCHQ